MAKKSIEISFVIVSYKDKEYLEKAIKSIMAHAQGMATEIIVVDNDNSRELQNDIQAKFEGIYYLALAENKGYGYALNEGAAKAKGECICVLNSDCEFASDVMKSAYERLFAESQIGVLAPQIISSDNRIQISWDGKPTIINEFRIKLTNFLYCKGMNTASIMKKASAEFYPEWATGACLFVKREVWDLLKGFDPCFFLYLEDCDFCVRARKLGFKILYYPGLKVLHYLGKSKEHNITRAAIEAKRSQLYFYKKHNGVLQQWFLGLYLGLKFSAKLLVLRLFNRKNAQEIALLEELLDVCHSNQ